MNSGSVGRSLIAAAYYFPGVAVIIFFMLEE
jgi:hypothetical protein